MSLPPGSIGPIRLPPPSFIAPEPPEVAVIQIAAASGDLGTVQQELEQYLQRTSADKIDLRHFSRALEESYTGHVVNMPILSYLLSKGVPLSVGDFTFAVKKKSYELMELFLQHGYDINSSGDMTCPPVLSLAIQDEPLARWLLARGADPNAETGPWDMTPLSFAVHHGTMEIIRLFFEHGGSVNHGQILHHAVLRDKSDCVTVVSYVLDQGAPINETMYQNRPDNLVRFWYGLPGTALQRAAELGKLDLVELLLARGADPSIKDNLGHLPIDVAGKFGHEDVVKYLQSFSGS